MPNDTQVTFESAEISDYGYTFKMSDLPTVSLVALAQQGWTHKAGNEVAAKVVAHARAEIIKGTDRKAKDVTKDEIQGWKAKAGDDVLEKLANDFRAEVADKVLAGTIGIGRPRVAAVTPVDKMARTIATEIIRNAAVAQKQPMPKGEDLAELVSDLLAGEHGENIRAKAAARLAETADMGITVALPSKAA